MIKKPTVFVLGAGASIPYGYPSGETLVKEIIDELLVQSPLFNLCRELEFNEMEINHFAKALNYSGDKSIDAFIERNPQYIRLGKIVITLKLIEREDENNLFSTDKKNEKWYRDLVNKLKSKSIDTFQNNVSFLTFNYDRSFDHYLYVSIENSYEEIKNPNQCAEVVNRIPIIHLHGHIGKLPWQEGNGIKRPYRHDFGKLELLKRVIERPELDSMNISEARQAIHDLSSQIKIISEKDLDKDTGFQDAKKLLAEANNIYFLGFGYHDDNLRRLNISELSTAIKRNISGTTHGLGTAKKNHIKEITNGKIDLLKINNINSKIVEFLEESVDFE